MGSIKWSDLPLASPSRKAKKKGGAPAKGHGKYKWSDLPKASIGDLELSYGKRPGSSPLVPIQEQHPEMSAGMRAKLKNFAASVSPNAVLLNLKKQGWEVFPTREGQYSIRKGPDQPWMVIDPNRAELSDVTDLVGDVGKAGVEATGAVLGFIGGGALTGGNPVGAWAGGAGGAGLGGGLAQAGLGKLGEMVGIESDPGEQVDAALSNAAWGAGTEALGLPIAAGVKGLFRAGKGLAGRGRELAESVSDIANDAAERAALLSVYGESAESGAQEAVERAAAPGTRPRSRPKAGRPPGTRPRSRPKAGRPRGADKDTARIGRERARLRAARERLQALYQEEKDAFLQIQRAKESGDAFAERGAKRRLERTQRAIESTKRKAERDFGPGWEGPGEFIESPGERYNPAEEDPFLGPEFKAPPKSPPDRPTVQPERPPSGGPDAPPEPPPAGPKSGPEPPPAGPKSGPEPPPAGPKSPGDGIDDIGIDTSKSPAWRARKDQPKSKRRLTNAEVAADQALIEHGGKNELMAVRLKGRSRDLLLRERPLYTARSQVEKAARDGSWQKLSMPQLRAAARAYARPRDAAMREAIDKIAASGSKEHMFQLIDRLSQDPKRLPIQGYLANQAEHHGGRVYWDSVKDEWKTINLRDIESVRPVRPPGDPGAGGVTPKVDSPPPTPKGETPSIAPEDAKVKTPAARRAKEAEKAAEPKPSSAGHGGALGSGPKVSLREAQEAKGLTRASDILQAADETPGVGGKALIKDVWETLTKNPKYRDLPLDDFKRSLIGHNVKGDVILARIDLPEAWGGFAVNDLSHVAKVISEGIYGDFHLIRQSGKRSAPDLVPPDFVWDASAEAVEKEAITASRVERDLKPMVDEIRRAHKRGGDSAAEAAWGQVQKDIEHFWRIADMEGVDVSKHLGDLPGKELQDDWRAAIPTAQPKASQPKASQPKASQPKASQPKASRPKASRSKGGMSGKPKGGRQSGMVDMGLASDTAKYIGKTIGSLSRVGYIFRNPVTRAARLLNRARIGARGLRQLLLGKHGRVVLKAAANDTAASPGVRSMAERALGAYGQAQRAAIYAIGSDPEFRAWAFGSASGSPPE